MAARGSVLVRIVAFLVLYFLSGLPIFAGSLLGWRRWESLPGTLLWALLIPVFWIGCRALSRWAGVQSLGLTRHRGWGWRLLQGFGIGLLHVGLILLLLWATGAVRLTGLDLAGLAPLRLLILILEFLYVAVSEEILFRSFFSQLMPPALSRLWVTGIGAALFAVAHVRGASDLNSLGLLFVMGVLYMLPYLVTGTLWISIGIHWAYNIFNLLLIEQEQVLAKSWQWEHPWVLWLYALGTAIILVLVALQIRSLSPRSGEPKQRSA